MNLWDVMYKVMISNPKAATTPSGFTLMFNMTLFDIWGVNAGSLPLLEIENYVGARHGSSGFDWSPIGAIELARAYASEYGEAS